MLNTTDTNAVDSLTAFATEMDYLLDNEGELAAEYNVPLDQVARCIACWQAPKQVSWQPDEA